MCAKKKLVIHENNMPNLSKAVIIQLEKQMKFCPFPFNHCKKKSKDKSTSKNCGPSDLYEIAERTITAAASIMNTGGTGSAAQAAATLWHNLIPFKHNLY